MARLPRSVAKFSRSINTEFPILTVIIQFTIYRRSHVSPSNADGGVSKQLMGKLFVTRDDNLLETAERMVFFGTIVNPNNHWQCLPLFTKINNSFNLRARVNRDRVLITITSVPNRIVCCCQRVALNFLTNRNVTPLYTYRCIKDRWLSAGTGTV